MDKVAEMKRETIIKWLSVIGNSVQRISSLLCFCGMFLILPMMLLTTVDVIGRAFFDRPIIGALEMCSYMLAIFILSSLAYTHQKKGHVMVSMIVSRLPERWQLILGAFTTILSLFVMAILIWQGWVTGIEERTVSDMLRIPERPFRLLVPVAGLLLFLELLIDLTRIGQKLFMRQ